MLVLVIGGFEVIRRIGNTLTPPHHIAGRWDFLVPASSLSCPLLEFSETGKSSLQVEQSGRYLMLTVADVHSTKVPARLEDGKLRGDGLSLTPCAAEARVRLRGGLMDDHLELTLTRSHKEASASAVATLVLNATRPPEPAAHAPASS